MTNKTMTNKTMKFTTAILLATSIGCGDGTETSPLADASDNQLTVPNDYTFDSRFTEAPSSVSYGGQTFRHILISELKGYIDDGLSADLASLNVTTGGTEIVDKLNDDYYWFGALSGQDCPAGQECMDDGGADGNRPILYALPAGKIFADIGGSTSIKGGKLKEKIAGFDSVGRDWQNGGLFKGWQEGTPTNADELVQYYFQMLQLRAESITGGVVATTAAGAFDLNNPDGDAGTADSVVFVDTQGRDINQLLQKFLLGAIAFHQATDDYLDSDVDEKGILASNTQSGSSAYSALEHAWDEGFGYYGAARALSSYRISAVSGKCADDPGCGTAGPTTSEFDADEDGAVDPNSEMHFGASINAAKRDWGVRNETTPTAIYEEASLAFRTGRAIIHSAGETLTAEELNALTFQRDIAVRKYEEAIAATAIHYINDLTADLNVWNGGSLEASGGNDSLTVDEYLTLAKHYSELKGFALSLQFSPHSPLTAAQFALLHQKLADKPVVPGPSVSEAAVNAYKADLIEARAILRDTYGFDSANAAAW